MGFWMEGRQETKKKYIYIYTVKIQHPENSTSQIISTQMLFNLHSILKTATLVFLDLNFNKKLRRVYIDPPFFHLLPVFFTNRVQPTLVRKRHHWRLRADLYSGIRFVSQTRPRNYLQLEQLRQVTLGIQPYSQMMACSISSSGTSSWITGRILHWTFLRVAGVRWSSWVFFK